jgi:EAL domain-containing protein (putative c-di-GMP-specific phosphodiesterase class I)/AmiR/NasT family two-component response regulator
MAVGTSPYANGASMDPIRVLIADDEPALRGALAELLAHEDHVVLIGTAGDADEAIQLADVSRPDVALVDVKMPAGGGPRAAREISRVSPDTRVIALSAFEDRPTVLEMLRAGAVGYLVKGTGADEIVGSIEKVMNGGTSLSAEVIGGIVQELTSQLRREEIEQERIDARRGEIERFMAGDGLRMVYQPVVDLRTRAVMGYEALARFRSLPLRPPNEWFAEAVTLELGVQLELTTVRQALRALPQIPPEAYLSINCSHRAAVSPELAAVLELDAPRIVIEITEHEAVEDYESLLKALEGLRGQGVRVAIDDAGSGFASMRHTLRIAPDIVKLDISLTRDIDTDRGRASLATALVSFADDMGMAMIAEGIETSGELDALVGLGVSLGQGYYLAEPGPLPGA